MNRRRFVQLSAAGIVTGLAGCGGAVGGSLEVTDVDASTTSFGNAVVRAMVVNESSSSVSGTLYAEADVTGGDTYSSSREITMPPESSNSYKFKFDVSGLDSANGWEATVWLE